MKIHKTCVSDYRNILEITNNILDKYWWKPPFYLFRLKENHSGSFMHYASVTNNLKNLGSEKWAVHLKARELIAAGSEVIELTIGEPDMPPEDDLIDECIRSMQAGRTKYSNGRGESNLLLKLKQKYVKVSNIPITEENILCFPGTQTALYATMRSLVEQGDEVIVGDPLYATYEGIIRASGATMVPVPLRREYNFILQAHDLEKAITPRTKVVLLNSPHNPTGSVMSKQDFLNIAKLFVQNDLWLVSDEVYEDLIFEGEFYSPLSNEKLAPRTVVVSSISKSHAAPGFRSGWAVGPREFCIKTLPLSETMLFGSQPFIADMTALALSRPSKVSIKMKIAYERRAKLICHNLQSVEHINPLMPNAGMFILIDIEKTNLTCSNFAWKLLNEQLVAVMPGDSFGHQARSFIRMSLTVPDKLLLKACNRISLFIKNLK
ncbi:MAG: pyridoxal phosphate-dependent aminotransferase [Paracoccaceae bacterium]|nr:pyridoxal phosphate-dependent aminotransferase [Paracoccaceae bacterium]